MSGWEDTCPLPTGRKRNGRPVWEPPSFDYSIYIGEEYEKQREAVLKYYEDDKAKATKFLDVSLEWRLLLKHRGWAKEEADIASDEGDTRKEGFFDALYVELSKDFIVLEWEFAELGAELYRDDNGDYVVYGAAPVEESMPGMVKMGSPMMMDRLHEGEDDDVWLSATEYDGAEAALEAEYPSKTDPFRTLARKRAQDDRDQLEERSCFEDRDSKRHHAT